MGGLEAHHFVPEGAFAGPAMDDLVVGREDVLDRDVDVRERFAIAGDGLLAGLLILIAHQRIVVDEVVAGELVDDVQVSLVQPPR
jgi:hypothetical protein